MFGLLATDGESARTETELQIQTTNQTIDHDRRRFILPVLLRMNALL